MKKSSKMETKICKNCGASQFKQIKLNGRNILECEYCGTQYVDSSEQREMKKPTNLQDVRLSGMELTGEYVVYGVLSVTGIENHVYLCKNVSQSAVQVRNLYITGVDNKVRVKLMPGSSKHVSGIMNYVG